MYGRNFQDRAKSRTTAVRGRWSRKSQESPLPDSPFGELVATYSSDHLAKSQQRREHEAKITNCHEVTTFNWLSVPSGVPCIAIPGEPPRWTPPRETPKLREDSGSYFRDLNAANFPEHPMEPTVVALLVAEPALTEDVDLLVCGSTFVNLLRFVQGNAKSFRFLAELVGNTVLFTRRERSPKETIQDIHGYGHAFPEAYTMWAAQVKQSESHQRLLKYTFADLDIIMRYEGDGYIPQHPEKYNAVSVEKNLESQGTTVDDLVSDLQSSHVSSGRCEHAGRLEVQYAGTSIPQRSTFDLKTRSHKKKADDILGGELPRLWARRIPTLILAYHQNGVFEPDNITIQNIEQDVHDWEDDHQQDLMKFAALLHRIIESVSAQPDRKLEVCYSGGSKLDMRRQLPDAGNVLSEAVKSRWIESMHSSLGGVTLGEQVTSQNTGIV